jgi:polysaccharide pyruvyl transferase WcaK-like protein
MRKKILIFGHYGTPNWGDEAILSGILSQLDFEKFSVSVMSDNPKWTKDQHKKMQVISSQLFPYTSIKSFLRSFFTGQFFKTKKAIEEADYVFFGGGGLFQDRPEKAIKIWNAYLQKCIQKKKKVFILGNSFEALQNEKNYTKTRELFQKIPFFSVRDNISGKILEKKFEVLSSKITESSDAAYFLRSHIKVKKGRRKRILLAFREGEEGFDIKKEKKIIKLLRETFPDQFEKNMVEVVTLQERKSGDKNFALRHNLPVFEPKNLEELIEKIKSTKFVLTSRLHGGILANICNTPFLNIYSQSRKKTLQFFGKEFSFSLQEIFTKKGEKKFIETLKDLPRLKKEQLSFLQKQEKKLENFFPYFFVKK